MSDLNKITTNIKGQMTPVQFIEENIEDVTTEEIRKIIEQDGFLLNSSLISNPGVLVMFKSGDIVRFNLDNLEFQIL